jgi:PAS domain S-box-containing protein
MKRAAPVYGENFWGGVAGVALIAIAGVQLATGPIYALIGLAFLLSARLLQLRNASGFQAPISRKAGTNGAAERLAESEARYRMLAETVPDIIVRYDTNGIIEYASPAIRQLGYEPESVIGRNVMEFHPQPDVAANLTLKALRERRPPPTGRQNESPVLRADGGEVWMQGRPAPIYDDDGQPMGIVTVLRDVTDRRLMENELRRRQAEADAAAVVKAQFLANMSHEIRTPLTGVIGFAQLLATTEGLSDRARGYVDSIAAGGQTLLSIVDDVLDFSRLENGRIELEPQPQGLLSLFQSAIDLVQHDAANKGLALRFEPDDDLPSTVRVDASRLRQVLLKLLANAIKFTPSGGVTVAVSYQPQGVGRVRVEVTDTGVGIAPEHSDRLFQHFSQVDGSNTRQFGGAGLGLAIAKGLVEAMGGEIGVRSSQNQGSTFWFTIEAPVADDGPAEVAGENQDRDMDMEPLRILVVDDVAANRELIKAMLAQFDVQLVEATNGFEAVEVAAQAGFDLILMDIQMPGMDGLTATRAIRAASGPNRTTPILAVSASILPTELEACFEAGMDAHVGKPINPAALLTQIATIVEEHCSPGRSAE